MPDRNMGRRVIALQNLLQLHFDGVARAVSDSSFRTDSKNKVLVLLRRALLDGAYNILANITGQPLVDRRDLRPEPLQLRNGHRTDLENRARQEVFNALLGCGELLSQRAITSGVLHRPLRQKLEERTLR